MKNSGKCPKCGSQKVGYQPGGLLDYQDNMVRGMFQSSVRIGRYYCRDCGFTEEWIDDMEKVQKD
jgi:predicted nucleic-acid-binding Zn-ribbon protein